jgi:hypothetical protein
MGRFYSLFNKKFKDGSICIVEKINNRHIIHIRLGFKLNFIDKLVLVDGTIIQNMQYELNAKIPPPSQLLKILKEPDETSYVMKYK